MSKFLRKRTQAYRKRDEWYNKRVIYGKKSVETKEREKPECSDEAPPVQIGKGGVLFSEP